jgi:hypothetical protein
MAKIKVRAITTGVSELLIEVISNAPNPFTRKRFSVIIAPAKIVGIPSAIRGDHRYQTIS